MTSRNHNTTKCSDTGFKLSGKEWYNRLVISAIRINRKGLGLSECTALSDIPAPDFFPHTSSRLSGFSLSWIPLRAHYYPPSSTSMPISENVLHGSSQKPRPYHKLCLFPCLRIWAIYKSFQFYFLKIFLIHSPPFPIHITLVLAHLSLTFDKYNTLPTGISNFDLLSSTHCSSQEWS